MALGSEFLNSSSLLVESGQTQQRGFRGCWSSVGVKAGYLIACLMVEGIHWYGTRHPEMTYLWRVAFLLALVATVVGYYIRRRVPESLEYVRYYANKKKPNTQSLYKEAVVFIKQFPFSAYFAFCTSFLSVTTGYFYYLYIPIHATQYSQHSRSFIMTSTILSLVLVTLLIPIFGKLSDRYNRVTFLTAASGGLALLTYPLMQAVNYGNEFYFLIMLVLISIPCACYYSVATVLLTELFPLPIRCTSLALIYSIAASLASGLPPLVSDYLAKNTHWLSSPSLVIIIPSLLVLMNIKFLLNKTVPVLLQKANF
jgi:MHS family proline/betaine transporter-like MFS transporter